MIAIGKPGEPPRTFFEGPDWLLAQQLLPGEVTAPATVDDNGRPIATPLPKASS